MIFISLALHFENKMHGWGPQYFCVNVKLGIIYQNYAEGNKAMGI